LAVLKQLLWSPELYAFETYSSLVCVTALVENKEKKEKENKEAR
jgi:hypothetical protein